jgi:hypothetical protein
VRSKTDPCEVMSRVAGVEASCVRGALCALLPCSTT